MADAVIDIDTLVAPIAGDNPAGSDLSFESVFDQIREARRADDAYLNQGDWKTDIKSAEWPRVRQLTSEALATQSKDLQLAAWLTEALGSIHGFSGLAAGFTVMGRIVSEFWDHLYPAAEDGDLDMRAGRIAWLNTNIPKVVTAIPVTAPAAGGYGWRHWKESKDVENLGRQNANAMKQAIAEGKISPDVFEKAVVETPASFVAALAEQTAAARAAFGEMDKLIDDKFTVLVDGKTRKLAPSLAAIGEALDACVKLATRMAADKGIVFAAVEEEVAVAEESSAESTGEGVAAAARPASGGDSGPPQNREEALRRLAELAVYFKKTEPQSPVSYLVDRAVKWGRMPLDAWLHEVVKDPAMLDGLREVLGLPPAASAAAS